ncbi:MAG: NYN domain-containing protein [Erysipelotrichia bacterium]|nr:NYN domain-containing protein [Erysipelotrichia bacterium]
MRNTEMKRIALLVDFDNFNEDHYFEILFEELDEIGDVIIGRVYFSNEEGKRLANKFKDLELDPIYQLRFSTGKNAVDIRMSIEAIELLSKDYINAFCLATHDSDFTPLVKKLKENNRFVIGAGRDNVSRHFKSACDQFINVEQIFNAKKTKVVKKNVGIKKEIDEITKNIDQRLTELITLVNGIIDQNKESDGYMYLSRLSILLSVKDKEFNPKNYGASNKRILPFFQKHLSNYFDLIEEKNVWKIAIKPGAKAAAAPVVKKPRKTPRKTRKTSKSK